MGEPAEKFVNPVSGEEMDAPATVEKPAGNAGHDAWREFRLASGYTPEEIEGKSREELKALADR